MEFQNMNHFSIAVLYIFNIVAALFILRVWSQYLRINTYNPFARFILKSTQKPIALLGNKTWNGITLSGVAIVLTIIYAKIFTEYYILTDLGDAINENSSFFALFTYFLLKPALLTVKLTAAIFIIITFIDAILSWFGQNTLRNFTSSLLIPIYSKFRRFIPPIGMIDLTPMIILFGLFLLDWLVEKLLAGIYRDPGFVFFLWNVIF